MTTAAMPENIERELGDALAKRIRALRGARQFTLDALAQRAGLSKGTVVALEQGKANPSIGVLCRLAAALSLSVTDLLADPTSEVSEEPIERTTPVILWSSAAGSTARLEAALTGATMFELWSWTLVPGETFEAGAHSPGTRELVSVSRGRLVVTVGHQSISLDAGGAIRLLTDSPHSYACIGDEPVEFSMAVLERELSRS
ncbi:helix-turn-helix transcriptional regulator [Salipiger thiooxidans]|uniref:helix-turn-helix domain-containing protein n=1 Tax=Salipiger thiooxidans TaxID=282683 RepID=UPI001A8E3F2A|nr:XRE family transcriptional regulator [Salipiger thiooxidans]MBN8189787.1 helix-turn-helix transcriptional regulator [Salipiger thiooxidans]